MKTMRITGIAFNYNSYSRETVAGRTRPCIDLSFLQTSMFLVYRK